MADVPDTLDRYKMLTQEERQALVKMDPDTFAPYIDFESYNFELVVA